MKSPVRVAVTGAAGQIGYALLFRIAAGEFLGRDQPVILQLLEIPPALPALDGVVMELDDCAFPTLAGVVTSADANVAFRDADFAFLVGARPRGPGMERADLLLGNAEIFSVQGRALNEHAQRGVKVLVIGNPANTNALIAMKNAPDLDPRRFMAMMRLDHNRALAMLAARVRCPVDGIRNLTVWGNHSTTQYPDLHHALVDGKAALELVGQDWYENEFIPGVAKRGAENYQGQGRLQRCIGGKCDPWTMPVTGCSALLKTTGPAWPSPLTVPTTFRKASCIPFPSPAPAVITR